MVSYACLKSMNAVVCMRPDPPGLSACSMLEVCKKDRLERVIAKIETKMCVRDLF